MTVLRVDNLYVMKSNQSGGYEVVDLLLHLETNDVELKRLPDNGVDICEGDGAHISDSKLSSFDQNTMFGVDFKWYYNCVLKGFYRHDKNDELRIIDYAKHWPLTYSRCNFAVSTDHNDCVRARDDEISPTALLLRRVLECHYSTDHGRVSCFLADQCDKDSREEYRYDFTDDDDTGSVTDDPVRRPPRPVSVRSRHVEEIRQAIRRSPNHMYAEFDAFDSLPRHMTVRQIEPNLYHFYTHFNKKTPYAALYTLPAGRCPTLISSDADNCHDVPINLYRNNVSARRGAVIIGPNSGVLTTDVALRTNVIVPDLVYAAMFADE